MSVKATVKWHLDRSERCNGDGWELNERWLHSQSGSARRGEAEGGCSGDRSSVFLSSLLVQGQHITHS